MRIFFQSVLYLSVGLGSLFFVIWTLTSFPFFQSSALAEETLKDGSVVQTDFSSSGSNMEISKKPLPVEQKEEIQVKSSPVPGSEKDPSVITEDSQPSSAGLVSDKKDSSTLSGDSQPPSAPASDKKVSSSLDNGSGKNKSVRREGASVVDSTPVPPPPPVSENIPPAQEEVVPPPDHVDNNTNETRRRRVRRRKNNKDVSDPLTDSASLNKLLKSAKDLQREKGASAEAAHDLMNINQKVMEIYKMLSNYEYDASDRRDPFTRYRRKGEKESKKQEIEYTHSTKQFKLDDITVKGLKWDSQIGPSVVVVQTPDSKIHHLRENDLIGNKGGVVYKIREDGVVVVVPRLTGISSEEQNTYVPTLISYDPLKKMRLVREEKKNK